MRVSGQGLKGVEKRMWYLKAGEKAQGKGGIGGLQEGVLRKSKAAGPGDCHALWGVDSAAAVPLGFDVPFTT